MVFGVETALWFTAAKKAGKWYREALEAVERFHGEVARRRLS